MASKSVYRMRENRRAFLFCSNLSISLSAAANLRTSRPMCVCVCVCVCVYIKLPRRRIVRSFRCAASAGHREEVRARNFRHFAAGPCGFSFSSAASAETRSLFQCTREGRPPGGSSPFQNRALILSFALFTFGACIYITFQKIFSFGSVERFQWR